MFEFHPLLNEPVVIDRNNKLILVHLPKTGGTSVAAAITKKSRGEGRKHWTLEDYRKKLPDFSEYHSFGFVRNPWARMAAWYRYDLKNHPTTTEPFDQWLSKPRRLRNPRRPLEKVEDYFFLDGKFALDSIGQFENLAQDFQRIVYPFLGKVELPHLNNFNCQRNYADYYTQKTIDVVAEKHEWVINKFGYRFEDLVNSP